MLTDLSFLDVGRSWPPVSELPRLQQYEMNRKLFEGDHTEVYSAQFERIERVIGNFQDIISYAVLANFQKLISLKTADLLLGEAPQVKCGEANSTEQKSVNQIIENSNLINTSYENAIDVSRYGDGLFLIYKDSDTKQGKIDVTQPSIWFPVVSPDNIKKIQYHVLAWKYDSFENGSKQICLKALIHQRGSYEERVYTLKESKIDKIINANTFNTGLDDFAVIQVSNLITSDRITGLDDYKDIDSLVSELEVRVSQIAKILDKHAAPSVQGPTTAVEQDPSTGEWQLKMGNYFPRDSEEDPRVEYLTWDAQMEANFKAIETIINLLYTISETGSTLFGDMKGSNNIGSAASGIALKRLLISPLAKVNRIRMRFDPSLKKAIKLCSQLGGDNIINLTDKAINIVWKDGLPEDPQEMANVMMIRTGNKPTISQYRAVQQLDNLTDEETQAEIDRIDEDESKTNPVSGGNFPFSGQNGGTE